jgi:hypothetical protein
MGQMGRTTGILVKGLPLLCLFWVIAGCSGLATRRPALQIAFSDFQIDEEAVETAVARVAVGKPASRQALPEAVKVLFSFLVQAPPDELVETKPHAEGCWRLDRIYLLDDCVAVQFAEGHYMETLFFVRNHAGWRLAARIRPADHW